MSDLLFFTPEDPTAPLKPHTPAFPASIPNTNLPLEDFNIPSNETPYTTYYLIVTTLHTDIWAIHGPVRAFKDLIPYTTDAVSSSPNAIEKLEVLRANPHFEFDKLGFNTFVVELERGTYSILKVLRDVNKPVHDLLPLPVYVVTSHGPLIHDIGSIRRRVLSGKRQGMAKHSQLIGSFVDIKEAEEAARRAMEGLVKDEKGIMRTECQKGGDRRGHCLLAISARSTWEIRIRFEGERQVGVASGEEELWII